MTIKLKELPIFAQLFGVILFCLTASSALADEKNAPLDNSFDSTSQSTAEDSPHEGYYLGVFGGMASPNKLKQVLRSRFSLGGQYGYRDDNYRTEVVLNFLNNDIKNISSARYEMLNLMFNVYYDFNYKGVVVPFLGAGGGYLNAWRSNCQTSNGNCMLLDTGSKFAYQGIAGVGFNIKNKVRLDFRYRYLSFSSNNNFSENIYEVVLNYLVP